jgi:hypothetical protein
VADQNDTDRAAIVDCFHGQSYKSTCYKLAWFQILTYFKHKYVIYGHGQWAGHIMDWAGCNYMHGRLPCSPVFLSVTDAYEWLSRHAEEKVYQKGDIFAGHHAGEYGCSQGCDDRTVVKALFFRPPQDELDKGPGVACNSELRELLEKEGE